MTKYRTLITVLARLALAAAWLLSAAVYIATPKPMAQILAMADGVRQGLGLAMAAPALLVLVGTIVRGRTILATIGTAVLAAGGVAWTVYDVMRHWPMFALFHAALAALAVGILLARTTRT
jgi:hypothetical protein